MPVHPSRTSPPTPRSHPTTASFTPADVAAFRLRPLGHGGVAASFASTTPAAPHHTRVSIAPNAAAAPATTHAPSPLPALSTKVSTQRSPAKVLCGAASYPASAFRRTDAETEKDGKDDGRGTSAIHVPSTAVPRVYAALVPTSAAATRSPAAGSSAEPTTAADGESRDFSSSHPQRAPLRLSAALSLVPASKDIVAPDLQLDEARELAGWTRDASSVCCTIRQAAPVTQAASASAMPPVETEVLHHWWRDRLAVRHQERARSALFQKLAPALESAVRSTLTAEEAYWQQKRSKTHACGIMNSTPANTLVPAGKMEPLMRAVQLIAHQTIVAFVEAQATITNTSASSSPLLIMESTREEAAQSERLATENDAAAAAAASSPYHERIAVLQATLDTERELVRETRAATSALATPSIITLPPESPIPPPALCVEAAVAATLLSCILEQAEVNTPGMAFAIHLLHHYILPHVYLDYPAWLAVRPRMGGLSEQVTHLATVPLRIQQQRDVATAAGQLQHDCRYLEAVVKAWTMRSWLRCVTGERRRIAQCAALSHAFGRLQRRLRLQRGFTVWQRRTERRQQQRREAMMAADFHRFVSASQAAAGMEGLWKGGVMVAGGAAGHAVMTHAGAPPALARAVKATAAQSRSSIAITSSTHSFPSSRVSAGQRHSSLGSKKKGAGHSRVYLSFLRQKSRTSSTARSAVPSAAFGETAAAIAGGQEAGEEDTDEAGELERFVVRNSDSDTDDDDDDDSGGGVERESGAVGFRLKRSGLRTSSKSLKSTGSGGTSLMYLEAPRPANDVAFPASIDVEEEPLAPPPGLPGTRAEAPDAAVVAPSPLFTAMMAKLQEMEHVNTYLRHELSVQSQRLRKAQADNNGLRQRNAELEEGTLRLVREKLEACNAVQQNNVVVAEKTRQIRQLRSRLRAHRHRPWQQTVMRLVGDVSAVSTAAAERTGEARVRRDRFGTADPDSRPHNDSRTAAAHEWGGAREWQGSKGDAVTTSTQATSNRVAATVGESSERPHQQQQTASASTMASGSRTLPVDGPTEQERLFGCIAPIVLHSTKQLPEARVILADWANSCLDDLHRLDDLHGGPFSSRFVAFSEETRSGFLISRLLYYLALPRYRAQTSAADASVDVPKGDDSVAEEEEDEEDSQIMSGKWTGMDMDPRRQLLEQHGVQLEPPYPVFEDCFNDILAMSPVDRMLQLLAFATELLTSQAGDPVSTSRDAHLSVDVLAAMSTTYTASMVARVAGTSAEPDAGALQRKGNADDAASSTATAPPTQPVMQPAAPIPLHTVVDPYALARGETSAVITLVALLYVRFAHPFHHKSRLCAVQERRLLLQLWSSGDATAEELAGPHEASHSRYRSSGGLKEREEGEGVDDSLTSLSRRGNDAVPAVGRAQNSSSGDGGGTEAFSIEAEMLRQLAPEDKTPWQLFRERCLPIFGTQAHPFLLRGGFWPAEAFDAPELAAMLGALAMALHRSLELHRWHVTLSCLVPVRTYSGLSRGVFTGPNASPAALELGLRQDGQEWLRLDFPLVRRRVEVRQDAFRSAVAAASTESPLLPNAAAAATAAALSSCKLMSAGEEIHEVLSAATSVWKEDLLSLFTQRACLSPQLALPVLDLGSWRLLCSDLGLIGMSTFGGEDDPDSGADSRESLKARYLLSTAVPSKMKQRALDLEAITTIFARAVMSVARERDEVDPAVFRTSLNGELSNLTQQQQHPSSSEEQGQQSPFKPAHRVSTSMAVAAPVPQQLQANAVQSENDSNDHVVLPDIQMDMTYAAFVLALTLLADELFPGPYAPRLVTVPRSPASVSMSSTSGTNGNGFDRKLNPTEDDAEASITLDRTGVPPTSVALQYCSLSMAFAELMRCVVLASPLAQLHLNDPRAVLRRLTCGLPIQMVLHRHSPALLLVYQAYSKDVFGEAGLLREDVLRMLRDAMLASAELTQYMIFDLFASCAVLRQASEEGAVSVRRDMDSRLRPDATVAAAATAARKPGYKAVRVVGAGTSSDNTAAAAAQRRRVYVLTFEGFCDLVCVLCSFKQPNVFVPFEERLTLFLRRSLLRPLTHTVPGLGAMLAQSQPAHEALAKEATPKSDVPAGAQAVRTA
jgi:hypothetical protein